MRWSLKIGQVFGIKLFIHWSFVILITWVFVMHVGSGESTAKAIESVLFLLALFACVLLHEMGHALTARRYGIKTRDITLLPIGGVARLERMPTDPKQELLVALAGPAVNVVIAALIFAVWWGFTGQLPAPRYWEANFFPELMAVNLFLVLFNMLPAFPMDGGRVLRSLLARRLSYIRATTISARIGQAIAVGFALAGILAVGNPLLVFIGAFVFIGAQSEAQMVRVTYTLRGSTVHDAMITRFRSLSPNDPLQVAVQELLAGEQQDFPVADGDKVVGLLTRADLVNALAQGRRDQPISDFMRPAPEAVAETDQLDKSYELLRQERCSTMPVLRDGRLVGMITLENILEWVMVNTALRQRTG